MTEDEMRIDGAKMFSAITDILDGADDNTRMYVIVNLAALHVLHACDDKDARSMAESIATLTETICSEIREAILANLRQDGSIPTVDDLLNKTRTQQ